MLVLAYLKIGMGKLVLGDACGLEIFCRFRGGPSAEIKVAKFNFTQYNYTSVK